MSSLNKKTFGFLPFLIPLLGFVRCKKHELDWNVKYYPTNMKHELLTVRIGDQIVFRCPKNPEFLFDYQYNKFYLVSLSGYLRCTLHRPKWVGTCDDNTVDTVVKLSIREYSPVPNGHEFEIGQAYYVISTSSGYKPGMNQTVGGLCSEHGLQLRFLVLEREVPTTTKDPFAIRKEGYDEFAESSITYQIHEVGELVGDFSANTSPMVIVFVFLIWVVYM